jgi:integrase
MHLTDIGIQRLHTAEGQKDYTDDEIAGLTLRVGKRAKTFMLLIGSGQQRRRIKFGRYSPPSFTLAKARSKAKAIIGEYETNGHQSTTTFQTAFDTFIDVHLKTCNKPSSAYETERLLRRHLLPALGKFRLEDITKQRISSIIDGLIKTPSECRHVYTAGKTFFRFCENRGYLQRSPIAGLDAPTRAVSRERVLSDEELKNVWKAAYGAYGSIVKLLILTGQRLNQIASLRAEFIDREAKTISWPSDLMKGNRRHSIPFEALTADIVKTLPQQGLLFPTRKGTPFNSWGNPKKELDRDSRVKDWTLHDLRRTFRTNMAALKVPPHVGERILDHRVGSQIEAIYDRFAYMD